LAAAQTPEAELIFPFEVPTVRFAALGGVHVTFADDFQTIWTNPAGMANVENSLGVAQISAQVDDIGTLLTVLTAEGSSAIIASLLTNRLYATADTAGPIALGYVNKGFGVGLLNRNRLQLSWIDPNNLQSTDVRISEEAAFLIGYAFRFENFERTVTFDAGILGRFFYRGLIAQPTLPLQEVRYIFQNYIVQPWETHIAGGFDFGIRFSYKEFFTIAATFYDFAAPGSKIYFDNITAWNNGTMTNQVTSSVRPRLQAGFSFAFDSPFLKRWISEIRIAVDYRGIWDLIDPIATSPSPLLQFGAGLEVRMLEAFTLRAGFSQMLPSGGLGLDMTWAVLDFAFFGKEFGLVPGVLSKYALAVSLSFRY
jgi:hypothetical protein